jgi:multidrug efflux pump subunit AcrB
MASVPIVLPDGKRLLLKDVADVEWGVEPKAGDGLINGEKAFILSYFQSTWR